jgi:hypothetical protein
MPPIDAFIRRISSTLEPISPTFDTIVSNVGLFLYNRLSYLFLLINPHSCNTNRNRYISVV